MREDPQALDSDDNGKGKVGHPLYEEVVPKLHLWQVVLPQVAPHCCHQKCHREKDLKCQEVPKLPDCPFNFFAPALGD